MLKIKSNTNEFTIIFSEKIGKKKNAQKISFSLCSVQHPFFFSPSFLLVSASFLFSASVFNAPLCFFSAPPLFFSAQKHFFQPKTILSTAQKHFFQPKMFLLQPKTFFSSAHTTVSASFCFVSAFFLFVGSIFSAPFLFVQRLLFFFFFQCLILFSLDVLLFIFQPKTFFNPSSAQDTFSSAPLFFCACLLLSFLPTSKAKNILSRCFTFLLFE